jgi:hypothetical protein
VSFLYYFFFHWKENDNIWNMQTNILFCSFHYELLSKFIQNGAIFPINQNLSLFFRLGIIAIYCRNKHLSFSLTRLNALDKLTANEFEQIYCYLCLQLSTPPKSGILNHSVRLPVWLSAFLCVSINTTFVSGL